MGRGSSGLLVMQRQLSLLLLLWYRCWYSWSVSLSAVLRLRLLVLEVPGERLGAQPGEKGPLPAC